ncbi:Nucleoside-diphosphate-sugar pyrophosphorylase [Methylacidimicrobium sp. AP8]|uniref:sugar phosphate nucleotidyltransferase n=1 Tax=Methylacidimicrobium sp. AP8 TaxID=2730359 RepID=UPI0018C053E4|nr:sugar phosphate nucleotidyltransferase [Methylacidimicrobium sp. AP8]CAB4243502.1 Nucleoside-diphosphate-sugar pyrophosphorylase [Methylacidimicrobium sp. AP8]
MKAMILAAGKGTRMGSLTTQVPKPMLSVGGRPVLDRIVCGLRDSARVTEFCLVVGHQQERIRSYFQDGAPLGVSIVYREQKVLDGTGRAPLLARDWVGEEPFLLSYGDILVDPQEYPRLIAAYCDDGVVAVCSRQDLRLGGAVRLDSNGLVQDIIEKPQNPDLWPNRYYNAGIYVFSPRAFVFMERLEKSPRGEYELTAAVRELARSGKVHGLVLQGDWADVRDPQVLAELNRRRH